MDQNVDVLNYVIRFSIAYFLLLIVLGVFLTLLNIGGSTGGSIGALLGAVIFAVYKFVEDNKRIPNKTEKTKLVWLSFSASWLISILIMSIVIVFIEGISGFINLVSIFSQLSSVIIIGSSVFISIVYLIALSFGYGSFAKIHIKVLQMKGKI